MSKFIVDINHLESKNNKIFFGEYSGFQRYDNPKFATPVKLEEAMRNAFWNPNEISMTKDSKLFFDMPKSAQKMMQDIWFYQTLMDSAQNRGLEETLASICTSPEWECMFKTWGYFEMIHSISYSHILRGIFPDASETFNSGMKNEYVKSRVTKEIEKYNLFVNSNLEENEESIKQILEMVLTIYALEGIKFYASFLMTYLINDNYNSIPGATRIIKLINYDEDSHTQASKILIDTLRNENGFKEIINSDWFINKAQQIFKEVGEDEIEFGEYLLNTGKVDFINEYGIAQFLQYYVDKRLSDISVPKIYNAEPSNTVKWFEDYKDMNKENIALQESDLAVYSIGTLKDDF